VLLACAALLLPMLGMRLFAQDPPPQGFLELVLAVPGKARCGVKIDGRDLVAGGLKSGECTGGLVMQAGAVKLEVEMEGYPKISGQVVIKSEQTSSYAIFLHARKDPKTGEMKREPRMKEIEPPTGRGFQLRVASLCATPQQITVAKRLVSLEAMQAVELPGWNGKHTAVEQAGKMINQFEAAEMGTYVLLVYDDEKSQLGCTLFRHIRYSLPPWSRPQPANHDQ
jgi:hypothetical protein